MNMTEKIKDRVISAAVVAGCSVVVTAAALIGAPQDDGAGWTCSDSGTFCATPDATTPLPGWNCQTQGAGWKCYAPARDTMVYYTG